ncbi:unnamed protein product, partial [Rotaria magnacalcarata]
HLAFYNCKMENDDQAALQALYDDGSLPQLAFYPEPRWDVILQVTNGSLNRGKICIIFAANDGPHFVEIFTGTL